MMRRIGPFSLLLSYLICAGVHAHPISISDTVIDVTPTEVKVRLRLMLEDLVYYYSLEANDQFKYPDAGFRKAARDHEKFLLERFEVRAEDGKRLAGRVAGLDLSQIPEEGVTQSELKARRVEYDLRFATDKPTPFITIMQRFAMEQPAQMDCLILQNGFLLEKSKQLQSGQAASFAIDWDNPPTERADWKGLRARKEEQIRQRLGITSYSALYSFLYITPSEIRHEILIPVLTLESWFKIPRSDPDFIEIEEQEAIRDELQAFLAMCNIISINGQKVAPKLSRLNFFGLDIRDFAENAPPRRVSTYQSRVGVILTFDAESMPSDLVFNWSQFNEHAPILKTTVFEHDQPPQVQLFHKSDRRYQWELDSSVLKKKRSFAIKESLSSGRAGKVTDEVAGEVITAVLSNIYDAYGYFDDNDIYDALETCVADELIRTLYLDMKKSLIVASQDNAVARVHSVELQKVEFLGSADRSFQYAVTWNVEADVEHWGHIHRRHTQYQAEMTIAAERSGWKLSQISFRSQKPVDSEVLLRR